MASLHLPERLRKNLLALSAATEEAAEELYQRLSALNPELEAENIPDRIAEQLTHWEKDQARGVVTSLFSLYAFRSTLGKPLNVVLNDVLQTLQRPVDADAKPSQEATFTPEALEKLRARLGRLLNLEALGLTAKALGVLTDHQRAYISARILSDIRAVFHEDISKGPAAAVIVHSLKIEFMENFERQECFFALDSKDLQTLTDVLERAKTKDVALRKILVTSNLPFLAPK